MKKEHLVLDSIHGLYYTIYLDTKLRVRYKIYSGVRLLASRVLQRKTC